MLSTMFNSDAIKGKSSKSGLLKVMQDRQYLTAYRRQSLTISLDSRSRSASFVQFGKARQPCKLKLRAELRHLRRAQSSCFVKRAFWMLQELASNLLSKDEPQKNLLSSPVSTVV